MKTKITVKILLNESLVFMNSVTVLLKVQNLNPYYYKKNRHLLKRKQVSKKKKKNYYTCHGSLKRKKIGFSIPVCLLIRAWSRK